MNFAWCVVTTTLVSLSLSLISPNSSDHYQTFPRWNKVPISSDAVECCGHNILREAGNDNNVPMNFRKLAFLEIFDERPKISFVNNEIKSRIPPEDTTISRLQAMERGVQMAINYARNHMEITPFPNLKALFFPGDEAKLVHSMADRCECGNSSYYWPPILAQNREHVRRNLFVTIPDFTFFTDFKHGGNHGTNADVWFDVMRSEVTAQRGSTFNPTSFEKKRDSAVWRGSISNRNWGRLRNAIHSCHRMVGTIDNSDRRIEKADMCKLYKLIITVPGNGVWSWATKFNLLCNSVTVLVGPNYLNGESWETRRELQLKEGVHYLGITADPNTVCRDIQGKVNWVRTHPQAAKAIAENGRKVVLEKLNEEAVLRDFANLLLQYAQLHKKVVVGDFVFDFNF